VTPCWPDLSLSLPLPRDLTNAPLADCRSNGAIVSGSRIPSNSTRRKMYNSAPSLMETLDLTCPSTNAPWFRYRDIYMCNIQILHNSERDSSGHESSNNYGYQAWFIVFIHTKSVFQRSNLRLITSNRKLSKFIAKLLILISLLKFVFRYTCSRHVFSWFIMF